MYIVIDLDRNDPIKSRFYYVNAANASGALVEWDESFFEDDKAYILSRTTPTSTGAVSQCDEFCYIAHRVDLTTMSGATIGYELRNAQEAIQRVLDVFKG